MVFYITMKKVNGITNWILQVGAYCKLSERVSMNEGASLEAAFILDERTPLADDEQYRATIAGKKKSSQQAREPTKVL